MRRLSNPLAAIATITRLVVLLLSLFPARVFADAAVSAVQFPTASQSITIKLARIRGLLLIDGIKMNGQPVGLFILDTGSNISILDRAIADRLSPLQPDGTAPQPIAAWSTRKIDSIDLGGVSITHHLIEAADLSSVAADLLVPLSGILGNDFLSHFPFTVDYRDLSLTLHQPASFESPRGSARFDLLPVGRANMNGAYGVANPDAWCPAVAGEINHVPCAIVLDTGNDISLTAYPPLVSSHPELINRNAGRQRAVRLAINSGGSYPANIQRLSLLDRVIQTPRFARAIAPARARVAAPSATAPPTAPGGALRGDDPYAASDFSAGAGGTVLEQFRLTFDFARKAVWAESRQPLSAVDRLAAGLHPNTADISGRTALMDAATFGNIADARSLLSAGADGAAEDPHGLSVLHMAAEAGAADIVVLLLKQPSVTSHINSSDARGITPLMLAASITDTAAVTALLDAGADPALVARDGRSALHFAAAHGNAAAIALLAKHHADVNLADFNGFTPLEVLATENGSPDAYDMLAAAGARLSPASAGNSLLHLTARADTVDLLRHLLVDLPTAPDVNGRNWVGETPLALAVLSGDAESVQLLLDHGANPNFGDKVEADAVPLHFAATQNRADLIRLLLAHGAKPDIKSSEGGTPLMFAAILGNIDALAALLDAHAAVDLSDPKGFTALHVAVANGKLKAARMLLDHGADATLKTRTGLTPADLARRAGNDALLSLFESSHP